MATFDNIAKSLLTKPKTSLAINSEEDVNLSRRTQALQELSNQGFSPRELVREIRDLFESTDDPSTKKQLLEMMIKIQGVLTEDKRDAAPTIILNVKGSNTEDINRAKLDSMLCPAEQAVA